MIAYQMVGTNNLEAARIFYEGIFGLLGGKAIFSTPRAQFFKISKAGGMFSVGAPYDGEAAQPGNGVMTAFAAPTPELVEQVYAKALELGGESEGEPGPRGESGNIFAYFRDLDGNKLAVCWFPPKA